MAEQTNGLRPLEQEEPDDLMPTFTEHPMDQWRATTERHIKRLKQEINDIQSQAEAQMAPLKSDLAVLTNALAALGRAVKYRRDTQVRYLTGEERQKVHEMVAKGANVDDLVRAFPQLPKTAAYYYTSSGAKRS